MATSKKASKKTAAESRAKRTKSKAARHGGGNAAVTKGRSGTRTLPPTLPVASYRVRGFVVHLGGDLPPARRRAALRTLAEQVPRFAHVVDERALARAKPLGKGSADVLIPLPRRTT